MRWRGESARLAAPGRFDVLDTERLLLRRWREDDRAAFAAINADPEVMRHFPAPLTRVESDALADRIEARFDELGVGLWAVERRGDGRLLGFTGLGPMPEGVPGEGELEVGWRLARHAWGRGYATEAARAAVGIAFAGLGLERVWSLTAVGNTRSLAVMDRLGMERVAVVDHPRLPPGDPLRPHVITRLRRPGPARPGR